MMPRYSKHGSNSDICTKSSEQTCILNDDFEINYLISVHSFWRISVNMVIERNPFLRFWNYHSHLQRRKSTVLTLKRMSKYLSTGCLFQMHAFKMTLIHLQVIRTLFHLLLQFEVNSRDFHEQKDPERYIILQNAQIKYYSSSDSILNVTLVYTGHVSKSQRIRSLITQFCLILPLPHEEINNLWQMQLQSRSPMKIRGFFVKV